VTCTVNEKLHEHVKEVVKARNVTETWLLYVK
jgi:hypothetical protein